MRTIQSMLNRIELLRARDAIGNAKIIKKLQRKIRNLSKAAE